MSLNESSEEFLRICAEFHIIWVASTPSLQLLVLEKLSDRQIKIIVEKPLASNLAELQVFSNLLTQSNSKIYLSQPWTYSKIWHETKQKIRSITGVTGFQATRTGNLTREAFSAEYDWAPHDLYLLADYLKSARVDTSSLLLTGSVIENKQVRLQYSFASSLSFELAAGFSNDRESYWKIICDNSEATIIDFERKTITGSSPSSPTHQQFTEDNPLITMLGVYLLDDPEVDWDLIVKIYSGLTGLQ